MCEEEEPDQGLERGAHKELTPQWREQDSMSTVDMPPSRVGDRNQGMEASEQEMSSDCVQHLRHRTTKLEALPEEGEFVLDTSVWGGIVFHKI